MSSWIVFACLSAVCWGGVFALLTLAARSRKMCYWGRKLCLKWVMVLTILSILWGVVGVTRQLPSSRVLLAFSVAELLMLGVLYQFVGRWAGSRIIRRFRIVARANDIKEHKRLSKVRASLEEGVLPLELLRPLEAALITLTLEVVGVEIRKRSTET